MNSTIGLRCPICENRMYIKNKTCTCGKHNYDISKEGYLNLVHSKSTAGDSKDMMISRRKFLDDGFYEPISNELNAIIYDIVSQKNNINIIDMGCGEGYYLNRLFEYLLQKQVYSIGYGLDLSKTAIKLASQKYKNENWLVANLSKLPFLDNSIDVGISMFANLQDLETFRVIKDNGYLILVRAGLSHLLELRKVIYPKIIERYSKTKCPQGFHIINEKTIKFTLQLKHSEDIKNLLIMTPHYWKVSNESRELLYSLNELSTTAEVEFYTLKKNKAFSD